MKEFAKEHSPKSELTRLASQEYFGGVEKILNELHAKSHTLEQYGVRMQRIAYFKDLLIEAVKNGKATWNVYDHADKYGIFDPDVRHYKDLSPEELVGKIEELNPNYSGHAAAVLRQDKEGFRNLLSVIENINKFGEQYGMQFGVTPTMSYREIEDRIAEKHDARMFQIQRGE